MNAQELQDRIKDCQNRMDQLMADLNYWNGKKAVYEEFLMGMISKEDSQQIVGIGQS